MKTKSAHKIHKNNSFRDVDLIIQLNTLNKASPDESWNTAIPEYHELHIINILKVYELQLLNDAPGPLGKLYGIVNFECTIYIKMN